MATLTDDVKAFIVQALACFDTPSQVVDAVREEFEVEVTRMQVQSYDPTKRAARGLAKKWVAMFEATRKRFLKETAEIPIASQSFRLRALQKMYERTAARGNVPLAAQLIEQAAKEAGGLFVNKAKAESEDTAPPTPQRFVFQVQDARRPGLDPEGDD